MSPRNTISGFWAELGCRGPMMTPVVEIHWPEDEYLHEADQLVAHLAVTRTLLEAAASRLVALGKRAEGMVSSRTLFGSGWGTFAGSGSEHARVQWRRRR